MPTDVNTHPGMTTNIAVNDPLITRHSDVVSPFTDDLDDTIVLDAQKLAAVAGSMRIQLTGRGRDGGLPEGVFGDPNQDGTLVVTLTDPVNGDFEDDLDVTYVDDDFVRRATKPKAAMRKPVKKPTKTPVKKPTKAPARKPTKASAKKTAHKGAKKK